MDEMAALLLEKASIVIRNAKGDDVSVAKALTMIGASLACLLESAGGAPDEPGETLMMVTPDITALYRYLNAEARGDETPEEKSAAAWGLEYFDALRKGNEIVTEAIRDVAWDALVTERGRKELDEVTPVGIDAVRVMRKGREYRVSVSRN